MEHILEPLQKYIASPTSIFDFKSIDYPTDYQQHLITSHYQTNHLLKTHSHNDIIRLLHTSQKTMKSFIAGILYHMLLQPTSPHFQAYMPSLRTQGWMQFGQLMQRLLADSFLWLKEQCRWGVIVLLQKLWYYRSLEGDQLVLAVKTMDYLDVSQSSLNYNSQMLLLLDKIVDDSSQMGSDRSQKNNGAIVAKIMFFKLMRMMSVLVCLQDPALADYKRQCASLMQRLLEAQKQHCLMVVNSGINVIKQLQGQQMLQSLIVEFRQALSSAQIKAQSHKSAVMRLSCVLPMRVQSTLLFIIRQNLSKIQAKLQLDWVFNARAQQSILLVIDIHRFIMALPAQQLPIKTSVLILQWLFYRVCSNNVLFQLWKDQLFFPCFAQPCPFPAAPQRAFHFLAYLFDSDMDFGQNLLVFLLRHVQVSKKAEVLRSMLTRANQLNIINLALLINHPRLRPRTKEDLLVVLGYKKTEQIRMQGVVQNQQPVYYDPFSIARKESQFSIDFSEQSHQSQHYANSSQDMMQQLELQQMGRVNLQKIFVEDMGQALAELLERPTMPIYIDFYKELLTITKQFRVSGQHQMMETFVSQTAKITYLLFQNQFEAHSELVPNQHNIIYYLLNTVAVDWRTNSFNLQLTKKIIKRIAEYFPTAELAVWRIFLTHFRRGVFVVGRQMKEWLIGRQKGEYAVSLLRELGSLTRDIIGNAEYLKLPY